MERIPTTASRRERDRRYALSEKGRLCRQRYNQRPFRRLMQAERNAARRALAGYRVLRHIFSRGPLQPCPSREAGQVCKCYSHALIYGILSPENTLLTPEQKAAWKAAHDRTRQLQEIASDAAQDVWVRQLRASFEAQYPDFPIEELWNKHGLPDLGAW